MKFYEVQPALEAGKKIRLSYWRTSLSLVRDNTTIYGDSYALFENGKVLMIWNPSEAELRADDWEIVEDISECKLLTHKKYLEVWKAEIEDIMSRENSVDVSMRSIKYQELYLWSIRVGVIDECLEHIKELTKTE